MNLTEEEVWEQPSMTDVIKEEQQAISTVTTAEHDRSLSGEELKMKLSKEVLTLPPMPQVVTKAQEVIRNPSSGIKELAAVLEKDQALVGKILKLANSAYYGVSGKVSSVEHASVMLGYKTLGDLILMAGSSNLLGQNLEGYGLPSGALWEHSLAVATGARLIIAKKRPRLQNNAFSAGLMHDVGKLVLDAHILKRKQDNPESFSDGYISLDREQQILGFDHAEMAAELCNKWRIPEAITKAVTYHHNPFNSDKDPLAFTVNMADTIALSSGYGAISEDAIYEVDPRIMKFLGITEDNLQQISEKVSESVETITRQMTDKA